MTISYNTITPTSLNTKGVIYNIKTSGGIAPYKYHITYNGSVVPFDNFVSDYIQGFSGEYFITVVDNNGDTNSVRILLSPTTSDETYCISCTDNNIREKVNYQTSQSFTLSYTPTYKSWTSFHTYNSLMLTSANNHYFIAGKEIHKGNIGNRGFFIDKYSDALIDYTEIGEGITNLNSLMMLLEVYDDRQVLQTLDSVDYISAWNQRQHTGKIPVIKGKGGNIRFSEGLFVYNDFRDIAKPYTKFLGHILEGRKVLQSGIGTSDNPNYKGVMNSTYNTVRLEFINKWNRKLVLNDIKLSTTQSLR